MSDQVVAQDEEVYASVITPGGLIVRMELDQIPDSGQRLLLTDEDDLAAIFLARVTGCRCTIHRAKQTTADPVTPTAKPAEGRDA